MRLVQLQAPSGETRAAAVEDARLRLLDGCGSVYALAQMAFEHGRRLADVVSECASGETLEYDPVYRLESDWRLLKLNRCVCK